MEKPAEEAAMAKPTEDAMAASDAMTKTEAMAGGEVMTKTDAMMDKPAEAMTDTHAISSAEAMTKTGEMAMTDAMTKTDAMTQDSMTTGSAMKEPEAMADTAILPDWQTAQLTNARTGEAFTLADFAGRTVFVEPFATWCTNCRAQLKNVREARAQLGDQPVFVALSVETNLKTEDVAKYTNDQGFDWVFAVMTPEMLKQLTDQFGLTIANPPSTPHFIIRPDGSTTDLSTGIKSVEALVAAIQAESK